MSSGKWINAYLRKVTFNIDIYSLAEPPVKLSWPKSRRLKIY